MNEKRKYTNEEHSTHVSGNFKNDGSGCQTPSIVYVREISIRYCGPRRKAVQIKSASDASEFLSGVQKDNAREHFMALFLDGGHQIISYATLSIGTATSTQVHPREVFQAAILSGSVALIVAHNHPSGSLSPSEEDRQMTKRLVSAGHLLGIPVLDHLILSDSDFFSFNEAGQLE
jgi:DNA repair protein RadC